MVFQWARLLHHKFLRQDTRFWIQVGDMKKAFNIDHRFCGQIFVCAQAQGIAFLIVSVCSLKNASASALNGYSWSSITLTSSLKA